MINLLHIWAAVITSAAGTFYLHAPLPFEPFHNTTPALLGRRKRKHEGMVGGEPWAEETL